MIEAMQTGFHAYQHSSSDNLLSRVGRSDENPNLAELREVTEEFESLFVKMMLDAMRKTLSDDTLIPKNSGEKLFEDQLYEEYAQSISTSANLGIATMMYDQLSAQVGGINLDLEA